ncbi:hypothetical protein HHI36_001441 [Cryptolaemus montrouzieri]|uniref:Zinc finger PHD-type domain-containing protein n=1 Tax=Cryptolaemus montrouzieri TaxID=559131 RepID=A0ABD2P8Z3_9CUCU
MLVGFRGSCRFKIPSKPEKYGIKIMALTVAKTHYLHNGYTYAGKDTDSIGLTSEEKKFCKPTESVVRLAKSIYNSNMNITAVSIMPLTDVDGVNDRSAKTRGGDNNEILCNYCNRKVIDFVECFKCKEFFHPSCLIKEAGVKSSTCQHEVKSANSGIQENTSPMDIEIENKFLKMQVEYLQALLSESQSKNLILLKITNYFVIN